MFNDLLRRCRDMLGNIGSSKRSTRRRSPFTPLAVEVLEDRAVMTVGGHPVDLVLNGFQLDELMSTDNDTNLIATVTITNSSSFKSKSFDITFYASADLSFYDPNADLFLKRYNGKSLAPGESITIERKIPDPVYYNNTFRNGYYIGVHINARGKVQETNYLNNALLHNPCTPEMIQHSRAWIASVFLGFGLIPGGTANNHLGNFLYGSGNPRNWGVGTGASNDLKNEEGYEKSLLKSSIYLNKELRKFFLATNSMASTMAISSKIVGTPKLGDSLDLAYAIAGTQGSRADVNNIRSIAVETIGNRRKITYTADIYITYFDKYEFDTGDSRKLLGNYARHLEMAGAAKPFDVSITAMTTVVQSFTI